MNKSIFTITENKQLVPNVYRMTLLGDTSQIKRPGQFVNIAVDGFYLRRPISVCDCSGDTLTLIYKTVGNGTQKMSEMHAGEKLDLLCGLGNGFDTSACGQKPLLVGGGVGVPPLYMLAKRLIGEGKEVSVILGFNCAQEIFYKEEFEGLGCRVYVTTADGSYGIKGFVTAALCETDYTDYCACGPEPMLKALWSAAEKSGQLSFEERMGCGFGACMGCTCKTKYKNKRICKDGPVLTSEEIIW